MARRSRRHWALDLLLGCAVADVGFSFGRDTYKAAKKAVPNIIVFCSPGVPFRRDRICPFVLIGLFIGRAQRPKRMERFAVEEHNKRFLADNGFRHVGGDNDTLVAPDGNGLQLEDERLDALVFKVLGRRVVRAKILLDGTGRMTSYVAP